MAPKLFFRLVEIVVSWCRVIWWAEPLCSPAPILVHQLLCWTVVLSNPKCGALYCDAIQPVYLLIKSWIGWNYGVMLSTLNHDVEYSDERLCGPAPIPQLVSWTVMLGTLNCDVLYSDALCLMVWCGWNLVRCWVLQPVMLWTVRSSCVDPNPDPLINK